MVFHEVYLPAAVQICNISTAHISFLLPILSPEPTSLVLTIKSWPNEVASYRKLETCINLRLRLAMTCVYLRWLAMTCVHFDLSSNLHERKFFTVWPPNASRRKLVSVLFSRFVRARVQGRTEMAFLLVALNLRLLASPFGHPSQVCVRKFTFPNLR